MSKKNPKSKRGDAERSAEWYAYKECGCVITQRAVRTQWQRNDIFNVADVVGKKIDGSHVYIQVTAGQDSAVTARKRKLEAVPWHTSDSVVLLQLKQRQDKNNKRRKEWYFRVWKYIILDKEREWVSLPMPCKIPRIWFTAYSIEKDQQARLSARQ